MKLLCSSTWICLLWFSSRDTHLLIDAFTPLLVTMQTLMMRLDVSSPFPFLFLYLTVSVHAHISPFNQVLDFSVRRHASGQDPDGVASPPSHGRGPPHADRAGVGWHVTQEERRAAFIPLSGWVTRGRREWKAGGWKSTRVLCTEQNNYTDMQKVLNLKEQFSQNLNYIYISILFIFFSKGIWKASLYRYFLFNNSLQQKKFIKIISFSNKNI